MALLNTETPNVSLVTMLEATDEPAVGAFVADVLKDSGWEIESLRKRSSRLSPPDGYWAMYEVGIPASQQRMRLLHNQAIGALAPFGAESLTSAPASISSFAESRSPRCAANSNNRTVGMGQFSAERSWDSVAHPTTRGGLEVATGRSRMEPVHHKQSVLASVAGDDGVVRAGLLE